MSAQPTFVPYRRKPTVVGPPAGARIVAYRCSRHPIFRVVWPEIDAPLVHPCPECEGASLRLI